MKTLFKFHPDLQACELETRLVLSASNLGSIVLTTSGYVLMVPYAGAAANSGGSAGGTVIPTSFAMTGSDGISNVQPGNVAGVPNPAATGATVSNGGSAPGTVAVSPGANDPNAPVIPIVSRSTIANDLLKSPVLIGQLSGDRSPLLAPGQFYRGDLPVTVATTASRDVAGPQARWTPAQDTVDPAATRPGAALTRLADGTSRNAFETLANWAP
jgi:hypothetical protein